MYELRIYMDGNSGPHYAKVDEETLKFFETNVGDDCASTFIGIHCLENGAEFSINRNKVNAYESVEVSE